MSQLSQRYVRVVDCQQQGDADYWYRLEPINFRHDTPIRMGQYFLLEHPDYGKRLFAYTTLPDEHGCFDILCSSADKPFDAPMDKGTVVEYRGPFGKGWPLDKLRDVDVLIVAEENGLAPLSLVIDYLVEQGQGASTTVIYGARDPSRQILETKRQQWRNNILLIETLEQGEGALQGTPAELITTVLAEHDRQPQIVLTCGSDRMMQEVADLCKSLVINSNKIWFMQQSRLRAEVISQQEDCCDKEQTTAFEPVRCYDTLCGNNVY